MQSALTEQKYSGLGSGGFLELRVRSSDITLSLVPNPILISMQPGPCKCKKEGNINAPVRLRSAGDHNFKLVF